MLRKIIISAAVAGIGATAWAGTPVATISARQNNFKQMGRAQKMLGDELKKPSPNLGVIRASANTLANLAPQVSRWFPRGTGKESGAKTGALPAIWQQTARFNGAANQFTNGARGLQRAAASGNLAQIRAALPAVGGACKGCHDPFKGDK